MTLLDNRYGESGNRVLGRLLRVCTDSDTDQPAPLALQLMVLRMCCNISSSEYGRPLLLSSKHVDQLVQLLLGSLIQVQNAAILTATASIVFNCAPHLEAKVKTEQLVAVLAGLLHAIPRHTFDKVCTFRLLMALGVLMWNSDICSSIVKLKTESLVDEFITSKEEEIALIAWEIKSMIDLD